MSPGAADVVCRQCRSSTRLTAKPNRLLGNMPLETEMVDTALDSEDKPVILVADDDEMQRFLMSEALEAEGFTVHVVDDGSAALQACKDLQPDVVLLDVIMPSMNGYTACVAIRECPKATNCPSSW